MQNDSVQSTTTPNQAETARSFGERHPRLALTWGVIRNLPKLTNVLPPISVKSIQSLRETLNIPTRTHVTRQPFDLSPGLAAQVRKLGLGQAVQDIQQNGFGIIEDLAPGEFTDQLRQTVMRLAEKAPGGRAISLLDKDPIFEEVVLNPKLLAIVEVMCGKGALLSQVVGRVIDANSPQAVLHVTQNQLPAPFPAHNQMVTFCWACDAQSKDAGAVKVVPGSHKQRRPPTADEAAAEDGAEAAECAAGSVTFWDGSMWHGRWPRTIEGQQVVVYVTFNRLALRPKESYRHLDDDWLAGKPFAMRVLLGREDGMDTDKGVVGSIDNISKFVRMSNWSKT